MATIQLHSDCPNNTTNIPNVFIDTFMPEANGEFVKVYLYLLRNLENPGFDCSISAIADYFNHTEKDVLRALKYWERMRLLKLEYATDKSLCSITVLNISEAQTDYSAPSEQSSSLPVPKKRTSRVASASSSVTAARRVYTLDEIKEFKKDGTVSELFFIIETYVKHPLSSTDINTVLYWYESLHFSTDMIEYLVEYCISKGHSSMRYMDKVALGWSESGIDNIEQAKANATIHSQAYYTVKKALGISGRALVEAETNYITRWTKELSFDLDIIQEACARTILATHQPSFEYTDSILTNWSKNQVHTLADVKALDSSFNRTRKTVPAPASISNKRNKFNDFTQRDYDFDQYEKMLLTTSVQ